MGVWRKREVSTGYWETIAEDVLRIAPERKFREMPWFSKRISDELSLAAASLVESTLRSANLAKGCALEILLA